MKRLILILSVFLGMVFPASASEIQVSGHIATDTIWNANTVKVMGEVIVDNGATLNISAGTYIEFQGYYKLIIYGTLLAVGTAENPVIFTSKNTTEGWHGIRFDNENGGMWANKSSKLDHCILKYGKATGTNLDDKGGAILINNFSNILISNCIFSNNTANAGGAICYNASDPEIINSLIINNAATTHGGGIYGMYSAPKITNCTISNNTASIGGGICLWGDSNPILVNTILWGNTSSIHGNQVGLLQYNCDPYFYYCNVQGSNTAFGDSGALVYDVSRYQNNIDADPQFVKPSGGVGIGFDGLSADCSLKETSPCINTGKPDTTGLNLPTADLAGNPRKYDNHVDIGAYEYKPDLKIKGDLNGDNVVDLSDSILALTVIAGINSGHIRGNYVSSGVDVNGDDKIGLEEAIYALKATGVIFVPDFQAKLVASVTSGSAPLTVNFNASATDTSGTTITLYKLSFGDATYDWSTNFGGNQSHVYTTNGTYVAVLTVTNARNKTATDSVTINVGASPPIASAKLNPSNGPIPVTVTFTGTGSDPDGTIVKYEWDFDGDGHYDFISTESGNTTYTYDKQGTFNAVFRVTDNTGLTAKANMTITAVRVGPLGSPTAKAAGNPVNGNVPLTVNFNGTANANGGTIVKYEWDFDGDGTYDWSSSTSGITSYTYKIPGNYTPAFRVTNDSALQGIDYMMISAGIQVSLSISEADRTFNPSQAEKIEIVPVLNAPVPANIKLKNKNNAVVKTISVPSGNSSPISWDGKDDAGFVVPDGIYYAMLEYTIGSQTNVFDPTLTTGGAEFSVQYDMLPDTPHPFNPYANQNLPVGFTLTSAAQISIFLGCFEGSQHVRTLLDHAPFGAGHHTIYWDGTDDEGHLSSYCPNKDVIFGVTGFTLPDNAIVVEGSKPVITNFTADPNYISPFSNGKNAYPVKINFTLSEIANMVITIFPMGKSQPIKTIRQNNVSAGNNTIHWNGKNESGFNIPAGDYRVSAQAQDMQGNSSMEMHTLLRLSY